MRAPADIRSLTLAASRPGADPYLAPQTSIRNKLGRVLWGVVYALLFRPSLRTMHAWRAFLLRRFGARLGPNCHIYRKAVIWAPWNLVCADAVAIGDEAVIYNFAEVRLGSHAIVSQQAYICTATHDYDDPRFPMIGAPIALGSHAWVCARAAVLPGVALGDGAVLALGSIATRNLEPWRVYAGNPAKFIKQRRRHTDLATAAQ